VVLEAANIKIDDEVLIRQCRRGDSRAMERLILKYQNRIYNVILKICGNPDDASELTQDTFVKAIDKLDTFKGKSSFYTWLFRVAVNLTLNYCKKSAKLGFRSLEAQWQGDEQARQSLKDFISDESAADPAQMAQDRELHELAIKAMMHLDDAQRAVVVLRDIEGMDYAQIAEALDIELGTVKSRLFRARSNLRQILEALL
jgi:RNA polymerase sigma-70 factor (ECF subfamily)